MKQLLYFSVFLASLLTGCQPKEALETQVDIDIQQPVVTLLADSTRQLDFSIIITQLGNYYYQDFKFELREWETGQVIDQFETTLGTAREFVFHRVIVSGAGNYYVTTGLGTERNGVSSGELLVVP